MAGLNQIDRQARASLLSRINSHLAAVGVRLSSRKHVERQSIMTEPRTTSVSFVSEHQRLHQRLLDKDATATKDLAEMFLDRLIAWLAGHFPKVAADLISDAAEDAILNLIRNPTSYRPQIPLEAYLQMSARGDLLNGLRRNNRDAEKLQKVVELARDRGNYQGQDNDPSSALEAVEEMARLGNTVPASVLADLTEGEVGALHLLRAGERRTVAFAEVLGIAALPVSKQRQIVKQVKDKLKKRLQRAGGDDE
jgi:DNA-directed RNA polymerase specialized sigma24 family protein